MGRNVVSTAITPAEEKQLKHRAAMSGLTVSAYIRALIAKDEVEKSKEGGK